MANRLRDLLPLAACFLGACAPAGCAGETAAINPPAGGPSLAAIHFQEDARSIEPLVNRVYGYLDRFEGAAMPLTQELRHEAEEVKDRPSLVRYAERALLALADHHAITGESLDDSWAVVPSFADLWVIRDQDAYVIEAVRQDSPAEAAGVREGDRLIAVDGVPVDEAVAGFWSDLGLAVNQERADFAARVLAAGRRDRPRRLTVQTGSLPPRALELPNLYGAGGDRPPLRAAEEAGELVIRFHDSLGDARTISAFDEAMIRARPGQQVVIDLRDTPGGGNSTVARAILGWFVTRPSAYQVHNLPEEERSAGIARQWVEQVLPRAGKHHDGPVRILVGRWTGSMGEGLAIGFDALGADVVGTRMAGLLGAIYDHRLQHSGLVLKLPTERLLAVDGTPREAFVPRPPP